MRSISFLLLLLPLLERVAAEAAATEVVVVGVVVVVVVVVAAAAVIVVVVDVTVVVAAVVFRICRRCTYVPQTYKRGGSEVRLSETEVDCALDGGTSVHNNNLRTDRHCSTHVVRGWKRNRQNNPPVLSCSLP